MEDGKRKRERETALSSEVVCCCFVCSRCYVTSDSFCFWTSGPATNTSPHLHDLLPHFWHSLVIIILHFSFPSKTIRFSSTYMICMFRNPSLCQSQAFPILHQLRSRLMMDVTQPLRVFRPGETRVKGMCKNNQELL